MRRRSRTAHHHRARSPISLSHRLGLVRGPIPLVPQRVLTRLPRDGRAVSADAALHRVGAHVAVVRVIVAGEGVGRAGAGGEERRRRAVVQRRGQVHRVAAAAVGVGVVAGVEGEQVDVAAGEVLAVDAAAVGSAGDGDGEAVDVADVEVGVLEVAAFDLAGVGLAVLVGERDPPGPARGEDVLCRGGGLDDGGLGVSDSGGSSGVGAEEDGPRRGMRIGDSDCHVGDVEGAHSIAVGKGSDPCRLSQGAICASD